MNDKAVQLLLSFLPRPYQKIQLSATTMAHLSTIKKPELKAFIHVRRFDTPIIPRGSKFKFPNKGSIDDANNGMPTLLRMAFDLGSSKILLPSPSLNETPPPPSSPPTTTHPDVSPHNPLPNIHIISDLASPSPSDLPPSSFLLDPDWIAMVTTCVLGVKNFAMRISCDSRKIKNCNILYNLLNDRFNTRIINSVCESKQDNLTVRWFRNNLGRFCCIVTLLGHTIEDIECATADSTLLCHPQDRFVSASGTIGDLEGCYLHYDNILHRWVRSGLAVGSDGLPRRSMNYAQSQHIQRSRTKGSNKRFELYYPDRTLDNNSSIRRGWFQNLEQYCAVGFDRSLDVASFCLESEGIFWWSEASLEEIKSLKYYDCTSLREKQLVMIGYCLELGYDLMINSNDNVARVTGFGTCLSTNGRE